MSTAGHCDGWNKTVDSCELVRSSYQVTGEHCCEIFEDDVLVNQAVGQEIEMYTGMWTIYEPDMAKQLARMARTMFGAAPYLPVITGYQIQEAEFGSGSRSPVT